jgi:uncharacterized membrane protein
MINEQTGTSHYKIIFNIAFPLVLLAAYIVFLIVILPSDALRIHLGLMLAYFIPPAGKESVIPLGIALGYPWWLMTISIALMDALTALFLALNFDMALKIPILGMWMKKFMDTGSSFFAQHKWIERLSFAGLVLFVMFPLQGSGGIGGTLVGRMLGMKRWEVVLAVTIGAFIGCFVIALGAEYLKVAFGEGIIYGAAALALLGAIIVALYLFFSKKSRLPREKRPKKIHR